MTAPFLGALPPVDTIDTTGHFAQPLQGAAVVGYSQVTDAVGASPGPSIAPTAVDVAGRITPLDTRQLPGYRSGPLAEVERHDGALQDEAPHRHHAVGASGFQFEGKR